MATLSLTTDDCIQVRLQLGTHVDEQTLSNDQIRTQTILGNASDYVFEKIRNGMDIQALPEADRLIAERFADEQDDDITNFINVVLKPPQRQQMRNAVICYCAGLCVPIVERLRMERAGDVTHQIATDYDVQQAKLFRLADDNIGRLLRVFKNDAFAKRPPKLNLFVSARRD